MEFLIYLLLLLIDSTLGIYYYRRLTKAFQCLTQLIVITFLFELISESLIQTSIITSNFPFYHVLLPIQLLYSALIYFHVLKEINQNGKLLLPFTLLLVVISILISIFYQNSSSFPTYGSLILSLFIIGNALFLYFKLMKFPTEVPILKQGFFWFNSGNFFFYAVTFFVFGYFEYAQGPNQITPAWISILIKVSNYILYSCLGLSLYFVALNKTNGRN